MGSHPAFRCHVLHAEVRELLSLLFPHFSQDQLLRLCSCAQLIQMQRDIRLAGKCRHQVTHHSRRTGQLNWVEAEICIAANAAGKRDEQLATCLEAPGPDALASITWVTLKPSLVKQQLSTPSTTLQLPSCWQAMACWSRTVGSRAAVRACALLVSFDGG